MKKTRAIEIIKELLQNAKDANIQRGYMNHLDDFEYYALMSGITNKELIELGFMPIDDEVREKGGFYNEMQN